MSRTRVSPALLLTTVLALSSPAVADEGMDLYRSAIEGSGSAAERVALLQRAATLRPEDACIANDLGDMLEVSGDAVAAQAAYRRALDLSPGFASPQLGLASAALAEGRFEAAAAAYDAYLAMDAGAGPACPELRRQEDARCFSDGCVRAHAALAHAKAGNAAKAESLASKLRQMRGSKTTALALRRAATVARDAGSHALAVRELGAALMIEPDSAWLHDALGVSLGQLNRWPEAQAEFEKALELLPGWADAAFNLGHAHYVQENWAAAADTYEAAWSWSQGRVNDRLLAEQRDAEQKAGRSGVLQASLIEKTIKTKGIGLRVMHDSMGLPTDVEKADKPRVLDDAWKTPLPVVDTTRVTEAETIRWGASGDMPPCNPAAPRQPARESEADFDLRLNFDFDSDRVRPESAEALDALAKGLVGGGSQVRRIELVGHADCAGTREYNLDLSMRRARSVAAEMAARGVPANLLQVDAKGFMQPRASNDEPEGRAQNRRVAIRTVLR